MAKLLVNGVDKGSIRIRDIRTECFINSNAAEIHLYFNNNEKIIIPFHNKPKSFNTVKTLAMGIRHWFKEYPYFIYKIDIASSDTGNIQIKMFQDDYGILKCHNLEWDSNKLTLTDTTDICDTDTDILGLDIDKDFDNCRKSRRAILVQDMRNRFTSQNNCVYATQYIHECDYVDRNDFYARLTGSLLKIEFGSMIHINKYVANEEYYNNCINDIREFICEDDKNNLIRVEIFDMLSLHNFIEIIFIYENSNDCKYYKTLKFGDGSIVITKSPTFDLHHAEN